MPPFHSCAMGLIDDITLGRFLERDSLLHQLDPRIKLLGAPGLIVAGFASADPQRLALLGLAAALLVGVSKVEWHIWWRGAWVFRWLLLFTLLLHLFLSPGRTLLGVSWISLDGLVLGAVVCAQLLLAVVFSSMITLTTRPQEIVAGLNAMLSPLGRVGLPVEQAAMYLLLVLHFIPVLRDEAGKALERCRQDEPVQAQGTLLERAMVARKIMAPMLLGLIERADVLAIDICEGRQPLGRPVVLKPLIALRPWEWLSFFLIVLLLVVVLVL